ncbi:hypothetical protein [Streptomyces sp. NPDC001744]|uniref:hypothetical protein n=1 Tax=Streptomyces sp. NPDC001744 TaxID=3364606 RepID=UPI00367B16B3
MSGFSNNYEADTDGLRETTRRIGGLAGRPGKLRAQFDRTVQGTALWKGWDDDFHDRMKDQETQQNESCTGLLDALEGFFTGLQSAVLESLGSIEGVQQEAKDAFHGGRQDAGNQDDGGHGKR